jgi:hypothetical protein
VRKKITFLLSKAMPPKNRQNDGKAETAEKVGYKAGTTGTTGMKTAGTTVTIAVPILYVDVTLRQ